MLEAPLQERQERAAATVERRAHIRWIDHGAGGHGYLRGDSRAFSALPLSLTDTGGASSPDTTPGELLAAAQCASFVVTLADLLAQRRTPALELTVDATCETEGGECGGKIRGLHVCVRGRGAGLESVSFADSAKLALACCPTSHALGATVRITLDADLAR
jgi:organic hydroperoxide reductase OsmC/OhrA